MSWKHRAGLSSGLFRERRGDEGCKGEVKFNLGL